MCIEFKAFNFKIHNSRFFRYLTDQVLCHLSDLVNLPKRQSLQTPKNLSIKHIFSIVDKFDSPRRLLVPFRLVLPVPVHLDEGGHDEEVDRPVEDIKSQEQKRENVGGCAVKTQLKLREFGLRKKCDIERSVIFVFFSILCFSKFEVPLTSFLFLVELRSLWLPPPQYDICSAALWTSTCWASCFHSSYLSPGTDTGILQFCFDTFIT